MLQIVMPVGGAGARFKEAGYDLPKPLIRYKGQPLIHHAWCTYAYLTNASRHAIVRPETLPHYITNWLPTGTAVHVVHGETQGPLETLWPVVQRLPEDDELLIVDCDSFLNPLEMGNALKHWQDSNVAGGVTVAYSQDPAVSYGSLDPQGYVLKTAERERISLWSTTGPYWWQHVAQFWTCAEQALQDNVVTCSPVYNYLLKAGGQVRAFPVHTFVHLGTPEALKAADA